MKKRCGMTALALSCWMLCLWPPGATGEGKLRVAKFGDWVFIRSRFDKRRDLVVRMGKGSNRQINFANVWLVNKSSPMTSRAMTGGVLIHGNGDDSTPWNINGTYIGANHGCSDARELTCPNHGRTAADLGREWLDARGARFCLIKIADKDRLWFLSRNLSRGSIWRFNKRYAGPTLKSAPGRGQLTFTAIRMVQLRPACRIKSQQYLIDGKTPLADGEPTACEFFDIVEEYDIINPASLVRDMIDHPGQERSFVADRLAGVIRNHITYRFHPNGACVIYYRAKALQKFRLGYMGFIQSARLYKGKYHTQEYYIPKTRPFTQDGIHYDFRAIQDYTARPKSPLRFKAAGAHIENPENLPDRFVQFLGRREHGRIVRDVGYALGYSLINGLTRPAVRAKNAANALMLYTSTKTYPTAIDSKMGPIIPAGTEFDCIAYRHYFYPMAHPNATCFYWHKEGDDTVVYADYHKAVDRDALKLPAELVGKKISIVETTPSLTLHTTETVPADGVVVSVSGDYGYVVFKVN